jgi:hypothetical protein
MCRSPALLLFPHSHRIPSMLDGLAFAHCFVALAAPQWHFVLCSPTGLLSSIPRSHLPSHRRNGSLYCSASGWNSTVGRLPRVRRLLSSRCSCFLLSTARLWRQAGSLILRVRCACATTTSGWCVHSFYIWKISHERPSIGLR